MRCLGARAKATFRSRRSLLMRQREGNDKLLCVRVQELIAF
jgi:hypothetical protein